MKRNLNKEELFHLNKMEIYRDSVFKPLFYNEGKYLATHKMVKWEMIAGGIYTRKVLRIKFEKQVSSVKNFKLKGMEKIL